MLPWLKPKAASVGLIVTHRKPDAPGEGHNDQDESGSEILEQSAKDLIQAVHSQDHKAVAQAFKDMFQILETQPHDVISHEEQD